MIHTIDGIQFKQMVLHGSAAIALQKQKINDLNVFPVPDGDTGTNMSLTIAAAATEMKRSEPTSVGQASRISGVNPADVTVLLIYFDRNRKEPQA